MGERHDPYISLRNPKFLWYVASLVAFTLGTQIQATVVAWQVYALTKDPLSLGLVGPATGGILYGFSGARLAYIVESFLCAIAFVLFGQIAYIRLPAVLTELTIGENLTVGIRFLMTQPELLGAQLLDLFSVLFGGAPALLPIFAAEILHVGPQGLGILRAAPAAGAVLISIL